MGFYKKGVFIMNKKLKESSFKVNIEDSILDDLLGRVKNSRILKDFGNKEWKYGTEETYLRNLVDYWSNQYDWKNKKKK